MRRRRGPWYHDFRARLRFERRAREHYPELCDSKLGKGLTAEIIYRLRVTVPCYEAREVEIHFRNGSRPGEPRISVDGPRDSPHRYRDGTLCVWEPTDDVDQRWIADDGLLDLIEHIRRHLFREAWWRDHGEWLGPEVLHWSAKKEAA